MVKLYIQFQEQASTHYKIKRAFKKVARYPWSQFSVDGFVAWLQATQGRTLQVRYVPFDDEIFGAWCTYTEPERGHNEEIFYIDESLTGLQRVQTFLHEVAHWLLDHKTETITLQALEAFAQGKCGFRADRSLLQCRATALDSSQQDREAEQLALLMFEQITSHRPPEINDDVLRAYLRV